MRRPLLFAAPGNESMAERICAALGARRGELETRNFPDGETYLRIATDPKDRPVALVSTLDRPDGKVLPLLFAAATVRELAATQVGLIAPYLAYMRQDRRFRQGEAVTSAILAGLLSSHLDWLVTVDPHLHRHATLGNIYSIPTRAARSAPLLAEWIGSNLDRPLLLGPDIESAQWVSEVAGAVGAPWRTMQKTRHGDRTVRVAAPDLGAFAGHTPVLLDDIVSSGRTMLEAADRVREQGLRPPVIVAIHALFSEATYGELLSRSSAVISADSVIHPSNAIDLSPVIAEAAAEAMRGDVKATSKERLP